MKFIVSRIMSSRAASGLTTYAASGLTTCAASGPFNWVNGARREPEDTLGRFANIEPRTGKILAEISSSGQREVDSVVACAIAAQVSWRKTPAAERGRYLLKAAELLRENIELFAKLDVIDNGKPIWEARMDMETVIGCLEYFGGNASILLNGQHVKMPDGSFCHVSKEPFGVVAGIGAWNYPLQTCAWKAAPAIVSGNTFVYKPSQFTPVAASVLGEAFKQVGLPDGVFNVIQGEGETGAILSQNKNVDKISFTGSVATGTKIKQAGK